MKTFSTLLSLFIFISCASSKDKAYTASTPAAPVVRSFLGIPLTDSIDFIRWKLTFTDHTYSVECNYGIGKPNTNGFYDNGKKVAFTGNLKKENNTYTLQNGKHGLKLIELNDNLLHILNDNNTLLIGGDGWSYALNSLTPILTDQLNLVSKKSELKDSMAFQGRTPCGVPDIPKSPQCYKLKWYIVLYAHGEKGQQGAYKILATSWRKNGGTRGSWKINTGKDGRIIYELYDDQGKPFIHLLKLDDGVLIFTDEKGNLLVGNLDFSYTLNRQF